MKKADPSREAFERYAQLLKVCGHPMRLQILFAFEKVENSCVKELWRCLGLSQPVVSQHLAVLKELGIVDAKTQKNRRIYSIVEPFVKDLIKALAGDKALKAFPVDSISD